MKNLIFSANDELESLGENLIEKYAKKYEKYKENTSEKQLLEDKFERSKKIQEIGIILHELHIFNFHKIDNEKRKILGIPASGSDFSKLEFSELDYSNLLEKDPNFQNLIKDKTALFYAARNIFNDCKESYKSPIKILQNIRDWIEKYPQDTEEPKILHTALELIIPFIRIEFLGFDPIKCTIPSFEYYGKINYNEINAWAWIEEYHKFWKNWPEKAAAEEEGKIIGKIISDRLKNIVKYLWNPLSTQNTENLSNSIHFFNKYIYNNAGKLGLDFVKQIIEEIIRVLNNYIRILKIPKAKSSYSERVMWKILLLLKNSLKLSQIVPKRGLYKICFERILNEIILENLDLIVSNAELYIKNLAEIIENYKKTQDSEIEQYLLKFNKLSLKSQ